MLRSARLLFVPALAALSTACLLVVDPEEHRADGGSGGAGPSTGGSGAAGPSTGGSGGSGAQGGDGGSGGSGGSGPCSTGVLGDAQNCGECGFECIGGGVCTNGVCSAASVVLADGGLIRSILAHEGVVYVVQKDLEPDFSAWPGDGSPECNQPQLLMDAKDPGRIRILPLDLAEPPSVNVGVQNVVGRLVAGEVGTHPVYFGGQNLQSCLPGRVNACNAGGCVDIDTEQYAPQTNAILPVGETAYIITGAGTLLSIPINDTTGLFEPPATERVGYQDYAPPIADGVGTSELAYVESPVPTLVWSTYDYDGDTLDEGCFYESPISTLGSGTVSCWTPLFDAEGLLVAADGTTFGLDGPTLVRFAGDPPMPTVVAGDVGFVRAIDDTFVYTTNTATLPQESIRLTRLDGTAGPPGPLGPGNPPIQSMDASHPDYLLYTAGNTIYRWPKPINQ